MDLVSGKNVLDESEAEQPSKVDMMHAMVEKFTGDLAIHIPSRAHLGLDGGVVLVTGTTGALGCHLLAQLMVDPVVRRVYALNRVRRWDQISLFERQRLALLDRGLDPDILGTDKVHLLEADLTLAEFGLPVDVYDEVSSDDI